MKIPMRVVFGFNLIIFLPQLHRWRCREIEVHQADSLSLPWKWHRSGDHQSAVRSAGKIVNTLVYGFAVSLTLLWPDCQDFYLFQLSGVVSPAVDELPKHGPERGAFHDFTAVSTVASATASKQPSKKLHRTWAHPAVYLMNILSGPSALCQLLTLQFVANEKYVNYMT